MWPACSVFLKHGRLSKRFDVWVTPSAADSKLEFAPGTQALEKCAPLNSTRVFDERIVITEEVIGHEKYAESVAKVSLRDQAAVDHVLGCKR